MPSTITERYAACETEMDVLMVFAATRSPPLDSDTVAAKFPRMMYLNAHKARKRVAFLLIEMKKYYGEATNIDQLLAIDWCARAVTNKLFFTSDEVVTAANKAIVVIQEEITQTKIAVSTKANAKQILLEELHAEIANIETLVSGFGFILHPDSSRLS